jgi:hypothetical protein
MVRIIVAWLYVWLRYTVHSTQIADSRTFHRKGGEVELAPEQLITSFDPSEWREGGHSQLVPALDWTA